MINILILIVLGFALASFVITGLYTPRRVKKK